jgi:progressive ankylosis protein
MSLKGQQFTGSSKKMTGSFSGTIMKPSTAGYPISFRQIFFFWLPLFLSWLLMTAEGPIIHAVLTRLADPKITLITLAAFGIVMSLSVTIESPVIMLLSTTTALGDRWSSYLVLRRFTLHLNILMTVVAAALAFYDPLYDFLVPGLMKIPEKIARPAQLGMKIMVLWSAAIGWRRFNQGLLIRFGQTKKITYGTAVRCVVAISFAFTAGFYFQVSGVAAGSIGLVSGVLFEAVFVYFAAREVKRELLSAVPEEDFEPLRYWDVVKFHGPLAATSILSLLAQPLIGAGLARMANPEQNLAVWPVIFGVLLIFRSPAFALPEIVIALSKKEQDAAPLRRFCLGVAFLSTGVMAFLLVSGVMTGGLIHFTGLAPELASLAVAGLLASVTLPMFQSLKNWLRGLLMTIKSTAAIYYGMAINLMTIVILVILGVSQEWSGVVTAGGAMAAATFFETIFLYFGVRKQVWAATSS